MNGISVRARSLGGVMGSVQASRALKLVFAASPLSTQHLGVKAKIGHPRARIMCLGKVACLLADCCFLELACKKTRLSMSV